jgi:hypothetical protein
LFTVSFSKVKTQLYKYLESGVEGDEMKCAEHQMKDDEGQKRPPPDHGRQAAEKTTKHGRTKIPTAPTTNNLLARCYI